MFGVSPVSGAATMTAIAGLVAVALSAPAFAQISAPLPDSQLEQPVEPAAQSLTEQLLDPDATPLARASGPKSLLPPSRQQEVAPPDLYGAKSPEVFFPSGEGQTLPPLEPAASFAARPGEEGTGIEVARLSGVADEGIGLVGPLEGGLSPMLWAGSRRLAVEDGLSALTPPPPSVAMANLFRRLLISRGDLPQGASSGRSILGLRLAALYAAGFARETDQLAGLVPMGDLLAQMAAPAARAALAMDNPDKACGYLTQLPTDGGVEDGLAKFALELSSLCQTRAGLEVAALLSIDLVREFGAGDTAFVALATRAAGGPNLDVPNDEIFTSLHLALAREAGAGVAGSGLGQDIVARVEPALLGVLAEDKSLPWPDRLALAEKAAARGLCSGRDLAEIYRRAIVAGADDINPRVSAFAVSLEAPDQITRLGAIAAAFEETPVEMWAAILPAFGGSIRAIAPSMDHADHAVFMTEALALLGDAVRADGWIGVAATAAPTDISRLETLVRIATAAQSSFVVPWNPDLALRAIDVRLENEPEQAKWLTAFEVQALASLGVPVPQIVWAQFDDTEMPGVMLGDAALRELRVAAEGRRAGDAALASLNAVTSIGNPDGLAELGPWTLTPGSLAAIVTALARSGLEADARQIAVEALVVRAHGEG